MAATAHSNQAMAKLPEACQCMIDYFLSHQAASGSLEGLAVLPGVVELLTRLKVGCQDEHLKHQISLYGFYRLETACCLLSTTDTVASTVQHGLLHLLFGTMIHRRTVRALRNPTLAAMSKAAVNDCTLLCRWIDWMLWME